MRNDPQRRRYCNYGGIALFDLLFGTFRNPRSFEHETGFYDGASKRVVDMLLGRDVSCPADPGGDLEAA